MLAPTEFVEAGIVDAEVVRELVNHRDGHLLYDCLLYTSDAADDVIDV